MTEEELFHAVLEKSRTERFAHLDQACAGNAALRVAVESLLVVREALREEPVFPKGSRHDH
jgi:hypothetical protein